MGNALETNIVMGIDPIPNNNGKLPSNPNIPTHFVDIVNLLGRSDGLYSFSFYTKIPGQNIEVSRIMVTAQVMESLHNNMGKIIESAKKEAKSSPL